MGCVTLINTFFMFLVSLFTITGTNIYTVCYEDTQAQTCYVYDDQSQIYQVIGDDIVPLQGNPVEAFPALTYIPTDADIHVKEVMPGLYASDFESSCALITQLIDNGYSAETLYRDPSRFEMRLYDATDDYRIIVSVDDCLRLYSAKSDIFDLVNTYMNGGN